MARSALQRLASFQELQLTWKSFWSRARKQSSAGIDGITPADFNKNLHSNLNLIRQDLLRGYKFDKLVAHPVPKPDGKNDRIICVPTVRDRMVQRLLGQYLLERAGRIGILNDVSYGFVPSTKDHRRGVAAARDRALALRHEFPWVYKSDISAFFDRVRRDILLRAVTKSVRTPSIHPILNNAINCEIDVRIPAIRRKVEAAGIKQGKGVRQGMPLSPFFANIMLMDFDKSLSRRGLSVVRYADDFIIFMDTEKRCYEADEICRNALGNIGLTIPVANEAGSKTSIKGPEESIEFLGMEIAKSGSESYLLQITDKQLQKIKRQIFQLQDIAYLKSQDVRITNLLRTLDNKIGGYRAAYAVASNAKVLNVVLDEARQGVIFHILTDIFGGEAIKKLSKDERRFLCLND